MLFFGWDVSTSVIGCACVDSDGSLIAIRAIRLDKIKTGLLSKFGPAETAIELFITECRALRPGEEERHVIEQRLKNMQGRTSKDTLLALASMNAVATYVIIKACLGDHTKVVHLYPVTVKKVVGLKLKRGQDKKQAAIDFARANCPEFPYVLNGGGVNPETGTDDMADAYITARAGALLAKQGEEVLAAAAGAGSSRVRKKGKERVGVPVPKVSKRKTEALGQS